MSEISKILEDVEKHCSGSTIFKSYNQYASEVKNISVGNVDYTRLCRLLAYGFIRYAKEDTVKAIARIKEKVNGKLILPKEIEQFVQSVLGLNIGIEDCLSTLNLQDSIEFRENLDLNSSDIIKGSLNVLLYYEWNDDLLGVKANVKEVFDNYYKFLVDIVTHNILTNPYGVLYTNKKKYNGYAEPFFLELNEVTGELDKHTVNFGAKSLPVSLIRETKIAKIFSADFITAEPDEFFYIKNSDNTAVLSKQNGTIVNFPVSKDKKVYVYPILIASLIYRRPMIFEDGKWKLLNCEKMTKQEYLDWLQPFILGEVADMMIKGVMELHKDVQYITAELFEPYLQNLRAYTYLQDFSDSGFSRGILEFYFGISTPEIKVKYEKIKHQFISDTDANSLKFTLYGKTKPLTLKYSEAIMTGKNSTIGYAFVFFGDENSYNGLTSFAYKTYALAAANGQKPSLGNLFLGVNAANNLVKLDLTSSQSWGIYISAGSRSGKGVLTLNLLAGLLGTGNYIMYLDNKPEMSYTFWQLERLLNAKNKQYTDFDEATQTYNPQYKRIFAIECSDMNYTFEIDKDNVIGRNSTRVKRAYAKGIERAPAGLKGKNHWGAMAYAKAFQLLCIFAHYPANFGIKGKVLIGVIDECVVASETLKGFIGDARVFATINNDKDAAFSYKCGPKDKNDTSSDYIAVKKYIDFLNSITSDLVNGINAFLTSSNVVKFIGIGQQMLATPLSGSSFTTSLSYIAQFISTAPFGIFGKNGNMFTSKYSAAGKYFVANNDKAKELVEEVVGADGLKDEVVGEFSSASSQTVSRAFIFQPDPGHDNKEAVSFKPLFALNENDFQVATQGRLVDTINNGGYSDRITEEYLDTVINEFKKPENVKGKSAVGGFLSVKKPQFTDDDSFKEFIKKEILIDNHDGTYSMNKAIGFIGLIEQVAKSADLKPSDILNNLSYTYDCCEQLLKAVGLWDNENYQCVEDYLYDCSPDSFMASSDMVAAIGRLGAVNLMDNKQNIKIDIDMPVKEDDIQEDNIVPSINDIEQENTQPPKPESNFGEEPEFDNLSPFNQYQQMMDNPEQIQSQSQPINNTTNSTDEQGFDVDSEQQDFDDSEKQDFDDIEQTVPFPNPLQPQPLQSQPVNNTVDSEQGFDDIEQTAPFSNPLQPQPVNNTVNNGQPKQRIVIDKQTGQTRAQVFDEQSQEWADMQPTQPNQSNQFAQPNQISPVQQDIEQYQGPQYIEPLLKRTDGLVTAEDMPNIGTYQGVLNVSALLLEIIQQTLGNLNRIYSFEVDEQGRIFVNDVLIAPTLTDEQLIAVPLDIRGKIKNGCWGYVFIYKKLSMYKRLVKLRIDDKNIAFRIIKHEFGVKNDWLKIKKWFSFRKVKLQELIICGQEIKEPEISTNEQVATNNYQQIEQEEERMSIIDRCREGFSYIGSGIRGFEDTCTKVGSSTIWNSKPVKFARAVGGAGLAVGTVALLGSMFGLLGAGAGIFGIYKAAFSGKRKQ